MKRTFLTLAVICALSTANTIHAQIAMNGIKTNTSFISNSDYTSNLNEEVTIESVSPTAIKDFKKRYASASNETWEKAADGYVASYTKDGVQNRVVYDIKGRWSHTILDYNADKLSKDLRNAIAFDHNGTITRVSEILTGKKVIHLVRITDKSTFKVVRICDGEMEVIEELEKK